MAYALIMAGGTGTRLWPLSRSNRPKQALQLVGERTMFQHSVDRLGPLFKPEEIFVVTRSEHAPILAAQSPEIPQANFIIEPEGRGTAPAIALGAIHLHRLDPNATMVVVTADHFISEKGRFQQALRAAILAAEKGHLVTLGISPSSPSTGFGYVQQGQAMGSLEELPFFQVERFTEKPNQETARQMVQSGNYSWNSGMFIWRLDRIMDEFARQMPEFYAQLSQVEKTLGTPEYESTIQHVWPRVAKQTIDYGIMEGARDVVVFPVSIGWSDIGSWASLLELLPKDAQGNINIGPTLQIDTHDSLVFGSRRLIATIGVEDMVIVDTEDALLICPKEREQDVREIVKRLTSAGQEQWL
jgi:mannose-1-phosphate guanylyltransferase